MGCRLLSVSVSSATVSLFIPVLIMMATPGWPLHPICISKLAKSSNAPERCCGAPEQQEQHTNIAVHGEKRSVQLAQIVLFYKRMFVTKERSHNDNSGPSRPGQSETRRKPAQQEHHSHVHDARNHQRSGDAETLRHGKQPSLFIEFDVLASVQDVKATHPQRDRGAQ